MKVLHVYRTYFPDPQGGLQEAIRQICLSTRAYGVVNTIFTLSPRPDPKIIQREEATIVRSRSWAAPASCDLGGYAALRTFQRLASEADVIHYLFPWPFADLLCLLSRHKAPAVMTYISDVVRQRWLGRAYAPLMRNTLNRMEVIVSNAPGYAKTSPVLSSEAFARKIRYIPLGINESSYPSIADATVLDRLGLISTLPYFLFVGVLRYYKGLNFLLDAAASVPVKIVIAGSGPESELLRERARQKNLQNVIFAGQVTDAEKVSLIQNCLGLILPSHLRSEAYGMVLVEAAMFGKPMITCEIGTGTSYVNAHEVTGLVVAPGNPDQLANAMRFFLDNPERTFAFGQGARVRYESLFSGDAMGQAYGQLFREVAGHE